MHRGGWVVIGMAGWVIGMAGWVIGVGDVDG